MTYSSPFNIPDSDEEELATENNWERLKREAEIRRVMELFDVVAVWKRGWERPNRMKWRGCLWKRESHFRVVMGTLEKRRTSVKWKAAWQALKSGVGGNRSENTEGNSVKQVVLGVGERRSMSRREARHTVIVLSSDSER